MIFTNFAIIFRCVIFTSRFRFNCSMTYKVTKVIKKYMEGTILPLKKIFPIKIKMSIISWVHVLATSMMVSATR